jgi:hypothetical protein
LVVGHTHSTIDQYFSVLANAINKCDFIGSGDALRYLFDTTLAGKLKPKINRRIEVGGYLMYVFVLDNYLLLQF